MTKLALKLGIVFLITIICGVIALPITPPDPISYLMVWIPMSVMGISFYLWRWRT